MEQETTLVCGAMKLNVLLAKAKRMILTKYNLSEQSRETYRVLRSVDFRDWHIFKTECFTVGSLLAVVDGEIGRVMTTGVRLWLIGCLSLTDCSQRHGY